VDEVTARITGQSVVVGPPINPVILGAAGNLIVAGSPAQGVVSSTAVDIISPPRRPPGCLCPPSP
jgi:hypothetical protein